MRTKFAVMLISAFLAVVPVWAHHSFAAEFDANKPFVLRGKVTKMEWVNPHAWIYIDVKNPDGSVTSWAVEGGSPNALLRRGFNKKSVSPGIEISVDAFPAKDGTNRANGKSLTLADGTKFFLGSSNENTDAGK